ncbi:telomeric DNA binding protein [Cytidiella melzeri]|nr:telomeric DNA binding protein [Cytidiella melzeri]
MSTEYLQSTYAQINEVIAKLQSPVKDLPILLELLASPLGGLNILPPRFVKYNTYHLSQQAISLSKHLHPLQRVLLDSVLPAWEHVLDENDAYDLVLQYFAPDPFSYGQAAAKGIAPQAYSTILSSPLTTHSIRLLVHLSKSYPIDVLWSAVGPGRGSRSSNNALTWEDCVRNVCAVPSRVANALGSRAPIPEGLEYGTYFNNMSRRLHILLTSLSKNPSTDNLAAISYLLTKLVNIGVFPSSPPWSPSQPSFFNVILHSIRADLDSSSQLELYWPQTFGSVSSISSLQTITVSLLSHLSSIPDLNGSPETRALVKREAMLLNVVIGPLTEDSEITDSLTATALGRQWTVGHARILACLAAGCGTPATNTTGVELLLSRVVVVWTTPDHIKYSLLAGHRYFTAFFLILLSYLVPPSKGRPVHPAIAALSISPPFINSITTYISHLDASVRRCGMLVAEEVARACGKKLDFGDWNGDSDGKQWCRDIRELVKHRDSEADESLVKMEPRTSDADERNQFGTEKHPGLRKTPVESKPSVHKSKFTVVSSGYDSDDSLTGYISEPASSRSATPTPSELEEIEKDPTLRVGKINIQRPVYLVQLGEMVRPLGGVRSEEEQEEPRRIEIALEVGEELIRRKRAYGTELEENAINLAYGFLGLQDKYEIEGFDKKREAVLTALVACCPQKAAQSLVEEFFRNQYSTDQRFALLNSLIFGARELAGLPIPSSISDSKRIAFPTKQLPPAMHRKYVTAIDHNRTMNPVQHLLENITQGAIARTKDVAEEKIPEIIRERRLRLKQPPKVTEVARTAGLSRGLPSAQLQPKFTEVAAEHFICPLMNRFWLFLRDEQARETVTAHQSTLHRYKAAGTGLILSALVLSQFLRSLAILVHMARNAPEFLAIIAPDALELAITVGTRPLTEGQDSDDEKEEIGAMNGKSKEAAVLNSSLELAIVAIDGCLEVDDGRSLGLEHTALLLAAGEWAGEVLGHLEKGERVLGGGGVQEMKLRRAAAGLALKVDELSTRWRRSMIGL